MKIMKPQSCGVALALFFSTTVFAQNRDEIPLREPVVSKAEPLSEHLSYRQNNYDDRGLNRVIDQVAVPTLTIYRADQPAHRGAAIVICPGGGYQYVVIDREGHMIARYFQQRGITAIVLKYRLPKPSETGEALPLPQQDALAAIQYVRAHARELGVDAKRVGVMGFSAGGHLAGSTAVFGDAGAGSRPDFVALLYPVVTLAMPYAHEGTRKNLLGETPTSARVAEYSNDQRAAAGMPPFFLAHARDDTVVPYQNSEMLAAALKKVGTPVELVMFDKGRHGFALGRDAESSTWTAKFLTWLDQLP
jgi:acetyl esterase/lipase